MKGWLWITLLFGLVSVSGCVTPTNPLYEVALSLEPGLSELTSGSIEVDGQTIAYLERAGDGETIVFLHGFAANKDNWIRFVRHLLSSYRLLIFDLPGHGDSSFDPSLSYDAFSVATQMWAAFDHLQLKRIHLVGHSLGGWIAMLQAIERPAAIISLGLFDSAGVEPIKPSELQVLLKRGDNPLIVRTKEDFERLLAFVFHTPPFLPWPMKPMMAEMYIARAPINQRIWDDLSSRLEQSLDSFRVLSMPTLVLWGALDRVLDVSSVAVYQEHLPNPSIVIMKDCGHTPMVEKPAEAAAIYVTFLGVDSNTAFPRGKTELRD